ncbi:hypothetical protein Ssi03_32060 [Sphaerisporangium siamense]|nr:hypothetical protein Ssi03_32060 [Sphaerisporangium siamense]
MAFSNSDPLLINRRSVMPRILTAAPADVHRAAEGRVLSDVCSNVGVQVIGDGAAATGGPPRPSSGTMEREAHVRPSE